MDINVLKSLVWTFVLLAVGFAGGFYYLPKDAPRWLYSLDAIGIVAGSITSVFVIVASIIAYTKRNRILDFLSNLRKRPEFHKTGHQFEKKVDAVIIPVSYGESKVPEWIINNLTPKFVALLCTPESCENGLKLFKMKETMCTFINLEADFDPSNSKTLVNSKDPQSAKIMTRRFISEIKNLDISRDRIFVDTTGGTVPTSIGTFQGAEEEGVSTIYIYGTVPPRGFIEDPTNPEHGEPIFLSDRTSDAHIT